MSTEVISFNLTEYTAMRTLQLEYSKVKDQNATIKAKLHALEELYRREVNAQHQSRQEWSKKEKKAAVAKLEIEREHSQLIESIYEIESELVKIDKMGIDLGWEEISKTTERMGLTETQKAKQKTVFIKKCLIELIAKSNQQAVQYEKEIGLLKQDLRTSRQHEKQLKEEILCLQEELAKMQQTANHLQNELSKTKRQYVDYKLKFYEQPTPTEEKHDRSEQMLEDNNFALDLLNFEKELLQKIFNKLLSCIQDGGLNELLGDVYSCYQSICEMFRQKLQIEYDLQDLEREYKKEKNSKISENLLIELRKQIEQFRNELQKQKLTLSKQEQALEHTFLELRNNQKDQKRMKTYTLEVERKIKDIKTHNSKNTLERAEEEESRIKFRPTQTTEQIMKEVVRKDRQNLQKLLRQTRMGYLKQTVDA